MHYRKLGEGDGSFHSFSAFSLVMEVCLVGNMYTHRQEQRQTAILAIKIKIKRSLSFLY